jgi:hypothetical protein
MTFNNNEWTFILDSNPWLVWMAIIVMIVSIILGVITLILI